MDSSEIQEKLDKWLRDSPALFEHPQGRRGEIWLAVLYGDHSEKSLEGYRNAGLSTVRVGPPVEHRSKGGAGKVILQHVRPVFANAREYIMGQG